MSDHKHKCLFTDCPHPGFPHECPCGVFFDDDDTLALQPAGFASDEPTRSRVE